MSTRAAAVLTCLLAAFAALDAPATEGHRVWHEGLEIVVVDRGGWAIFEGDIIIGRTDAVLQRSQAQGPDGKRIGGLVAKSNTLGSSSGRWPRGSSGLFEVPYVIETDPDGTVPGAITLFNQQLSGFMRAVPRTTETDYVAFTLSATDTTSSCSSSIGRIGGRQVIQGSHSCGAGVLVHEIGHALGIWHEQVHGDAAGFIQVRTDAVDPAYVHNYLPNPNRRRATPYDFASVMHYASTNFAREGQFTLETIPPGIPIGQRNGYSSADLEGIRRLYGDPPQRITVNTNPPGLAVLVDGSSTATPATFDWAIGSNHIIDVPANAQVSAGVAYAFGRWNVDANGDMSARRNIAVSAGDGTITQPTSRPAVSTYVANFTRHKEVRLTTSGNRTGVGGTVSANPLPTPLPGLSGTFYRERQPFTLDGIPNGGARLGAWGGSFLFLVAHTTSYSSPFRGPVAISDSLQTAYEYRAQFVDFPFITIRAVAQAGDVLGLTASVTRGTAAPATIRMPYNTTSWADAESATVAMTDTVQSPFSDSMRYVFRDWDGNASPTIAVVNPSAGQASRTLTANFSKEYQAYREVIPSCGGSITLPGGSEAWYAHGSNVSVSLATNAGWVLAAWEGSVGGSNPLTAFSPTTNPQVVARLNTIPQALTVTNVSPATLPAGQGTTITIDGSGFTPASEVYVAGIRQPSTFVSANRLTAAVAASGFPASGLAIVTVTNRPGISSCSVSATGGIDLIGTAAVVEPQTGWWWNSAESGRGFFIEKRGNNLFMAGYYYEADGRPTWFSAAGPMSGAGFSGDMTVYRGGQTLTGNYVAPTPGSSPGRVTLAFDSATTATLTWPGGVTPLTRFPVGGTGNPPIENGWWWNSGEPGRGFSIEIQGSAIFAAGFMYDTSGNPVWYYAQGSVSGSGAYSGVWLQASGGQTLTGAYRPPTTLPGNAGTLALEFSSTRAGTLTLPNGRRLAITRFDF